MRRGERDSSACRSIFLNVVFSAPVLDPGCDAHHTPTEKSEAEAHYEEWSDVADVHR
jgi:hypothetical protein